MPLETGPVGSAAFKHNIATEVKAGKPQKQAVAIAYRTAGERNDADPHRIHDYMDAVCRGDSAAMASHSFHDR
jgi:hypothetical protein